MINLKTNRNIIILQLILSLLLFSFVGCNIDSNESVSPKTSITKTPNTPTPEFTPTPDPAKEMEEILRIQPNEAGKIMVVMFHNLRKEFKPSRYNNGEYTTTFENFEKLLNELYEKKYRLISIHDYLDNNISVPAGCIPMIFTFDDGTPGQFNLIEKDGKLVVNPESAVGIMEKFYEKHPDFGLEAMFTVNLSNNMFDGEGTLKERINYLIDSGFEIGNHTLTHAYLNKIEDEETIKKEIGGNQKKMYELVPGYKFRVFSLPYGKSSEELWQYVIKGEYDGIEYENEAILEVAWSPTYPPFTKDFDPHAIQRVRAPGMKSVEADLHWWMDQLSYEEQFVSDGNPETIAIPESQEENIDKEKTKDKRIITYEKQKE